MNKRLPLMIPAPIMTYLCPICEKSAFICGKNVKFG